MSERYDPRERWRWEEEREREDQGLESEGRFARHGGDPRWGTGGLGVEPRAPASRSAPVASARPEVRGPYLGAPYVGGVYSGGPYVGYGPRGYHRSDERIHEDVCERFTDHGDLDASDIEVAVLGGEVTLSGTVATRSQKRLAEDIADAVTGVAEVHNRLRVQRPGSEPPLRGAPTGGGHGLHEGSAPGR
jgi:hypothetical protein